MRYLTGPIQSIRGNVICMTKNHLELPASAALLRASFALLFKRSQHTIADNLASAPPLPSPALDYTPLPGRQWRTILFNERRTFDFL